MAKVYVPQQPSRMDTAIRAWVPTVNLEPAKKFGEVIVMLPPEASRLHVAPLVEVLKHHMRDFGPDDHIVAVGDPSLFSAACCIAAKKNQGRVRMLKWDRVAADYIPVEFNV